MRQWLIKLLTKDDLVLTKKTELYHWQEKFFELQASVRTRLEEKDRQIDDIKKTADWLAIRLGRTAIYDQSNNPTMPISQPSEPIGGRKSMRDVTNELKQKFFQEEEARLSQ